MESGCTSSAADNAPQERGDPLCTIADVGNRAKPRSPAVWADERLVDEIVELVVGLQERIGPLPQLGIAHAFAIQDCGAFREVMVVYSLQENSLRASGQTAWNVAPVKYNQSVPLFRAPFAAGAVEKIERRTNGAVVLERKGRQEPRGRG